MLSTAIDISSRVSLNTIPLHSRPPPVRDDSAAELISHELRLPKRTSLLIVQLGAALCQVSFFIIVSSASAYAEFLGGTATFSGLVIGIPTLFSGIALIPMSRTDQGKYTRPLHVVCASLLLGNVLHALAYRAHFLYLILIGRIVSGFGFTWFMYSKRYCSDPRIVGVRRRTTLAGWLVVGQGFGFSAGPFLGGLLFKIGFRNTVFNGYTSPGWIMAGAWAIYWAVSALLFQDVEEPAVSTVTPVTSVPDERPLTRRQWGVIACMCWYAMTCFFTLGAWEANLPVYTAAAFGYSPYQAGNFIALGGIATFPLLLVNVLSARRVQDRVTLALGSTCGLLGLLTMLGLLLAGRVSRGGLFACWFLVALGFNLATTCTLSLLSKQLPATPRWNARISLAIQYSNYCGRICGAVWGGAGVHVGMTRYIGLQIGIVGVGWVGHSLLWRELKAKTG